MMLMGVSRTETMISLDESINDKKRLMHRIFNELKLIMARKPKIDRFNEKILSRFQIYNSLFLTLPFKNYKANFIIFTIIF